MDDSTWVEILSGTYTGIIYSYGKVKFTDELGVPKLSFGYNVLHSGQFDLEALQNDEDFVIVMGDILTEILVDEKNGSTRSNDTEEPDLY